VSILGGSSWLPSGVRPTETRGRWRQISLIFSRSTGKKTALQLKLYNDQRQTEADMIDIQQINR
jgi:hypothetical protein